MGIEKSDKECDSDSDDDIIIGNQVFEFVLEEKDRSFFFCCEVCMIFRWCAFIMC